MRPYLQTGAFWSGAAERCLRTICQVLLSVLTVDGAADAFHLDWKYAAGIALTAGLTSLLMSVVAGPIGPPGSPSIVNDRPAPNPEVSV